MTPEIASARLSESPLNPPFLRGETNLAEQEYPPLKKGGQGGILARQRGINLKSAIGISLLCLFFILNLTVSAQQITSPQPDSSAFKGNLNKLLQENPLPYDQDLSTVPLVQIDGTAATLVQVRSKFSGTYHAAQDEMLYIISGRGIMIVGGETKPIQPGDLVVIKNGQTYTIENRSVDTLVALAVVSDK